MKIPPNLGGALGAAKTAQPKAPSSPQFSGNQAQKAEQPTKQEGPQKQQQDGGLLKQLLAFAGSATRSSDAQTAGKAKQLVEQAGGGGGGFSAIA